MEPKKTPQADLEKKRLAFLIIGLVIATSATLVAFEWKTFEKTADLGMVNYEDLFEEESENTLREPPPPPPETPPPPPEPENLEIVEDEEEIENEMEIQDVEVDENQVIDVPIIEEQPEVVEELEIFTIVEDMPEFPGGQAELFKYLQKNIKYPSMAKDANIQGTVYVTFVINENGDVKDIKVLRGIGGGCNEEAIRVVKNMPSWKAGKQRGKPVKVQYNLPIKFSLR